MNWKSRLLDKEKVYFKKQFSKKELDFLKVMKEAISNRNKCNNKRD
jgi:hypothetical protein